MVRDSNPDGAITRTFRVEAALLRVYQFRHHGGGAVNGQRAPALSRGRVSMATPSGSPPLRRLPAPADRNRSLLRTLRHALVLDVPVVVFRCFGGRPYRCLRVDVSRTA